MRGVRRITEALTDRALPQGPGRRKSVVQRLSKVTVGARHSLFVNVFEAMNDALLYFYICYIYFYN